MLAALDCLKNAWLVGVAHGDLLTVCCAAMLVLTAELSFVEGDFNDRSRPGRLRRSSVIFWPKHRSTCRGSGRRETSPSLTPTWSIPRSSLRIEGGGAASHLAMTSKLRFLATGLADHLGDYHAACARRAIHFAIT